MQCDVRTADRGGRDLPEGHVEVVADVQARARVQRNVFHRGGFQQVRDATGRGLVRAAWRITTDRLPVDDLDLAAEFLGEVAPDLHRDRLRLQVPRRRPVIDRGHGTIVGQRPGPTSLPANPAQGAGGRSGQTARAATRARHSRAPVSTRRDERREAAAPTAAALTRRRARRTIARCGCRRAAGRGRRPVRPRSGVRGRTQVSPATPGTTPRPASGSRPARWPGRRVGLSSSKPSKPSRLSTAPARAANRRASSSPLSAGTVIALIFTTVMPSIMPDRGA